MNRINSFILLILPFFFVSFYKSQPTEIAVTIKKENYFINQGNDLTVEVQLINQTNRKINLPLVPPTSKLINKTNLPPKVKDDSENELDADLEIYFSKTKAGEYKKLEYKRPYYEAPRNAYPDPIILEPQIKRLVNTHINFGFIYQPGFYKLKLVYPYHFENQTNFNSATSNWIYLTVK